MYSLKNDLAQKKVRDSIYNYKMIETNYEYSLYIFQKKQALRRLSQSGQKGASPSTSGMYLYMEAQKTPYYQKLCLLFSLF